MTLATTTFLLTDIPLSEGVPDLGNIEDLWVDVRQQNEGGTVFSLILSGGSDESYLGRLALQGDFVWVFFANNPGGVTDSSTPAFLKSESCHVGDVLTLFTEKVTSYEQAGHPLVRMLWDSVLKSSIMKQRNAGPNQGEPPMFEPNNEEISEESDPTEMFKSTSVEIAKVVAAGIAQGGVGEANRKAVDYLIDNYGEMLPDKARSAAGRKALEAGIPIFVVYACDFAGPYIAQSLPRGEASLKLLRATCVQAIRDASRDGMVQLFGLFSEAIMPIVMIYLSAGQSSLEGSDGDDHRQLSDPSQTYDITDFSKTKAAEETEAS